MKEDYIIEKLKAFDQRLKEEEEKFKFLRNELARIVETKEQYKDLVKKLKDLAAADHKNGPGKQILQGIYIHDFGPDMKNRYSVPMDVFRKSVETICESTYSGVLDGFIVPQAGWFCMPDKYEHIRFLRDYIDWFDGTTTVR